MLLVAARVGTSLQIAGVLAFLLVVTASGLIPGVDMLIKIGTLADTFGSLWDTV
jgi:hypothetical protein